MIGAPKIFNGLYTWPDHAPIWDGLSSVGCELHIQPVHQICSLCDHQLRKCIRQCKMLKLKWFNVLRVTQGHRQHNHSIDRMVYDFLFGFNRNYMRLSRTDFEIGLLSLIFQKLKRSRNSDHAPFRDSLSSVGWDLLWSTHIPNYIWNEEMKGNAKCKNSCFEPPVAGLIGVTHFALP